MHFEMWMDLDWSHDLDKKQTVVLEYFVRSKKKYNRCMEDIPFQHCDLGCCAGYEFKCMYTIECWENRIRLIITLRSWNKMDVQVAWKNNFYVGGIDQQLSHRCKDKRGQRSWTLCRENTMVSACCTVWVIKRVLILHLFLII